MCFPGFCMWHIYVSVIEVAKSQIHIFYKMDILDKQKLPISAVARLDILSYL
jgi:hypothetical protein